jgi:cell division septal protein FtsQ
MTYRRKHIKPKIKTLRAKKNIWKRFLFFSLLALEGLAILGTLYAMFFSSYFKITTISVSGNEKTKTEDIQNIATETIHRRFLGLVYTDSMILVDTNAISKNILHDFPAIENVSIHKAWPHEITISVQERKSVAVFCQEEQCFAIDAKGIIFQTTETPIQETLTIRQSEINSQLSTGEDVVNENIMKAILQIQNTLKNNFHIDIKEALIAHYLVITTAENWQVYFDQNANINLQIARLNALLQSEINETTRKTLQYIYLQYGDRAYYK